jgi:hypothetical protein
MKQSCIVALLSLLVLTISSPITTAQQTQSTSRYQATFFHSWRGVRSCCDGGRKSREIKQRFNLWLAEVKANNPSWQVTSSGVLTAPVSCHRQRHEGRRRCTGRARIKAYVDYVVP